MTQLYQIGSVKWCRVLLRCPTKSSGLRLSSILSTAATRSGRCICPRQRSPRSPDSHLRFESADSKKADTRMGILPFFVFLQMYGRNMRLYKNLILSFSLFFVIISAGFSTIANCLTFPVTTVFLAITSFDVCPSASLAKCNGSLSTPVF